MKGLFGKFVVLLIIVINIWFTIEILAIVRQNISEPSTLIGAWFSFTTVELWSLSKIKQKKVKKDANEVI